MYVIYFSILVFYSANMSDLFTQAITAPPDLDDEYEETVTEEAKGSFGIPPATTTTTTSSVEWYDDDDDQEDRLKYVMDMLATRQAKKVGSKRTHSEAGDAQPLLSLEEVTKRDREVMAAFKAYEDGMQSYQQNPPNDLLASDLLKTSYQTSLERKLAEIDKKWPILKGVYGNGQDRLEAHEQVDGLSELMAEWDEVWQSPGGEQNHAAWQKAKRKQYVIPGIGSARKIAEAANRTTEFLPPILRHNPIRLLAYGVAPDEKTPVAPYLSFNDLQEVQKSKYVILENDPVLNEDGQIVGYRPQQKNSSYWISYLKQPASERVHTEPTETEGVERRYRRIPGPHGEMIKVYEATVDTAKARPVYAKRDWEDYVVMRDDALALQRIREALLYLRRYGKTMATVNGTSLPAGTKLPADPFHHKAVKSYLNQFDKRNVKKPKT